MCSIPNIQIIELSSEFKAFATKGMIVLANAVRLVLSVFGNNGSLL